MTFELPPSSKALVSTPGLMLSASLATLLSLSACGGGGSAGSAGTSATTPAAEPVTPAVVSVPGLSAQLLADSQLQVVLSNTGSATAFCVRTDSVTPVATDACFKTQTTQTVPTNGSATAATLVRAWTLTGQTVAAHQQLSAAGKTCSTAAYQASNSTTLPTVCVITNQGEMVIALEKTAAPNTVANFLRYANDGFYNNTCFHRVTSVASAGFSMVQGGGLTCSYLSKTPTYSAIAMEAPASTGLSNTAGTIAMARTSNVNSASSGFFINASNNSAIFDTAANPYAVFGRVIYGQASTLAGLAGVAVVNNGSGEVSQPATPQALQWLYQLK